MLSALENPIHLLFLFVIVMLLFGAKRLPEVGRGLGSAIRDFKSALVPLSASGDPAVPSDRPAPSITD